MNSTLKISTGFAAIFGLVFAIALAGQPDTAFGAIYSPGFEAGEGYTGAATQTVPARLDPQNGWTNQFGAIPNFNVYTYAGHQVPYTPSGAVPVIGGIPQLVNIPQNPTGGNQFVASGNQGRDMHAADYTPSAGGLVEISVDYHPGDWFDNNGGNFNGALTIRPGNAGGFYSGHGSAQADGDANGNGPWAPGWQVWDAANAKITNHSISYRYDGVDGFDNLPRSWHRIGYVFDTNTGIVTQLKSQELTPGEGTKFINGPTGPIGQTLYIASGSANTSSLERIGLYNVGNGTLSAFDNAYVGEPYDWPVVPGGTGPLVTSPEPSSIMIAALGLLGLGVFTHRRRRGRSSV